MENLPAKRNEDDDNEAIFPMPDIFDDIPTASGQMLHANYENAYVAHHEEPYEEFNHLHITIKYVGEKAMELYLYGIDSSPLGEYLRSRYRVMHCRWPTREAGKRFIKLQVNQIDPQWEKGLGHEFDDEEGYDEE